MLRILLLNFQLFNFFQLSLQLLRNSRIKVIFNIVFRILMQADIRQDIKNLENDILQIEDNVVEFLRLNYDEGIKRSLHQLESNLKYLSVLANGAPIEKNEDIKIMDFLRTHYNNLQKLSAPR